MLTWSPRIMTVGDLCLGRQRMGTREWLDYSSTSVPTQSRRTAKETRRWTSLQIMVMRKLRGCCLTTIALNWILWREVEYCSWLQGPGTKRLQDSYLLKALTWNLKAIMG